MGLTRKIRYACEPKSEKVTVYLYVHIYWSMNISFAPEKGLGMLKLKTIESYEFLLET